MINHQDFVAALEPAPACEHVHRHTNPRAQTLVTESRQCEPRKRSPLPSVREIDAAIERKYGSRAYRD
jgi:hypothetical protein